MCFLGIGHHCRYKQSFESKPQPNQHEYCVKPLSLSRTLGLSNRNQTKPQHAPNEQTRKERHVHTHTSTGHSLRSDDPCPNFDAMDGFHRSDLSTAQSVGASIGIDVEQLYRKYARYRVPKPTPGGTDPDTIPTPTTTSPSVPRVTTTPSLLVSSSSSRSSYATATTLTMCPRCQGTGLVPYRYNHQVRDQNCDVCHTEGVVSKPVPRHGPT